MNDIAALIAAVAALLAALPPFIELYQKNAAARKLRKSPKVPSDATPPPDRSATRGWLARNSRIFPVILLFIALILYFLPRITRPVVPTTPTPSPDASATSTATVASTCGSNGTVTITSPRKLAAFNGAEGVALAGTACGLNGRSIWAYDLDPSDRYYYPDADGPIITSDGPWQYLDVPIGDDGDNRKIYAITLIWADDACANALLATPTTDGDQKFNKIPAPCSIAATIDVVISNP